MNTYSFIRVTASVLASIIIVACGFGSDGGGSGGGAPTCVPGDQTSCVCANGHVGHQTCADDGASFGDCQGCTSPLFGCTSDAECGASTPCAYYRCDEQRECVVYHVPYGTKIIDKDESGNCLRWSCDGAGNEVRVYDPNDSPDGGACGK